jgi:hypothetical protein
MIDLRGDEETIRLMTARAAVKIVDSWQQCANAMIGFSFFSCAMGRWSWRW